MIRVALLRNRTVLQGGIELIGDWSEDGEDCVWVDISDPVQSDVEPLLEEWFRFHELAAEDALSPSTLPKYDSFPRYDFFVFRMTSLKHAVQAIETEKLSCFLGRNFLITIARIKLEAIDAIWSRLPQDARHLQRGVDFAMYSFLDYLVDEHFPLLDDIEERMDNIQTMIFSSPSQTLLDELLELKRELNVLRRALLPQRELLNQMSRGNAKFIQQPHLIYFRDLYDHMYRIGESIDVERDMATTTMEAYLSVVANRTNDIMKVLTVFSAMILPMTLITGIYGMNFPGMPEFQWRYGQIFAFALMAVVAVVMMMWFWRKGWLWPRRGEVLRRELHIRRALHRRARKSLPPAPS
ncbi:MAG TPA: magnesium/cobalt transporter CorA [Thermoanaerobaculia bacterium]|nr:magnesium/cobalt transporter CorA [Thermoanaerobaculia bacterium]